MATASRNDQAVLPTDPTFQKRVKSSIIAASISIINESWNVAFHRERSTFAAQVVNSPDTYMQLFANTVATDASVIADATQAGTVPLTSGNVATQQALVTDAHIDNAVSSQFNSLFRTPGF